ncbi:MAG: xanthine phosphoribosyltransferase [Bacilli bacterium]|nr:xanthine phosphoribosyltransferase [Bacilli bacterium]
MKELEERILKDGVVINGEILKVDSFINHQIDVKLLNSICAYLTKDFKDIDKILTIETSGIAFAVCASEHLGDIPVVFAKKSKSKIVDTTNVYTSQVKSFTRDIISTITVDKRYVKKGERVLIIDDFMAEGNASLGLIDICDQAGALIQGVGVAVEKKFQGGRERIEKLGYKVVAGASIIGFENGKAVFAD